MYDLYTQIIQPEKNYYIFPEIESMRFALMNTHQIIDIQDYGAGSKVSNQTQRKVSQIARHSLASHKEARLLFKLVNHFQPNTLIELGTSLGITTLYLASANSKSQVFTFEGCPNTAQVAQNMFIAFELKNIDLTIGNIDQTLKIKTETIEQVDFVYFDANHRLEPTLRYFEILLEKSHENSVFVLDDIHWSKEMQQAWAAIKKHPKVNLTIDLFSMGLVFFRKGIEKQDFILRF